jgi:heptosyltransferase-3
MKRGSQKNRLLDLWVGVPVLNVLATLVRRHKFPSEIRRIGMMCSPALGDTLLFSAVFADVRAHFPKQHLICFCTPQNVAAAMLIPGADDHVVIEMTKPFVTIQKIREENLDLFIDFSSWQRLTAFYMLASGARFTAGFRTSGQFRERAYDVTVEHRSDQHEIENFRSLVRSLGIAAVSPPYICPPAVNLPGLPSGHEIIVFHLWPSGAHSWLREWPEDRWAGLASRLAKQNTLFVITGAPPDLPNSERFVHLLRNSGLRAEVFVGYDGFSSLCQVLLHAKLVVSVNTGVMHLSAILGVPTFSLNGPTNNARWGPIGPVAFGIQSDGDGCGYLNLGFEFKKNATDCMERISVDKVVAAIDQHMAKIR